MATKHTTTTNANASANAILGLSNAELDAELMSELPEREEMCGFHHFWHPCYVYSPCYEFHPIETFSTSYSSVTTFSSVSSFVG